MDKPQNPDPYSLDGSKMQVAAGRKAPAHVDVGVQKPDDAIEMDVGGGDGTADDPFADEVPHEEAMDAIDMGVGSDADTGIDVDGIEVVDDGGDPGAKSAGKARGDESPPAGESASESGGGGGRSTYFATMMVEDVRVISFSRADVLDAHYIEQLGDAIYESIAGVAAPKIVIDLGNVSHLSSAAIGMLIALQKVAEKQGGRICIANIGDAIMEVFKLTKLHKIMKLHDSVGKAAESLR